MKTTGIVRRIDELGRIVIPKEIRKNLRIKNGESLEIFVEDENIVLKKFSAMENLESIAQTYVEAIHQTIKHEVIVTDRDKIIAVGGSLKRKYYDKNISSFIDRSIERRDSFVERQKKEVEIIEGEKELCTYSFSSIINNGDCLGSVIILSMKSPLTEADEKQAIILANLLSKNFDD